MPNEPSNTLHTRVELDTETAQQQQEALILRQDQIRLREYAEQEKLIRSLSTMSVEEMEKQIAAQEKLLSELNLKQEQVGDAQRQRMVQEWEERRQEHRKRIEELDLEGVKLQEHYTKLREEKKALEQSEFGSNESREAATKRLLAIETEIGDVVERSRQAYVSKTQEAYEMEKDRLDTIKGMLEHEKAKAAGEEDSGGGLGALMGGLRGLPDKINAAGASASKALSPFLRLFGVAGVAFSLEQVLEKLYKANAELREIRNSYANIALEMGDVAGGGGMFIATNFAAMDDLRRRAARTGAVGDEVVPGLARTFTRAGFAPEAIPGLAETSIGLGAGYGVSPMEIGQTAARLYREFHVSAADVMLVTREILEDVRDLRTPFQDLAKWTLSLTEQTRIYGYSIEDSRHLVRRFAHELHEGIVSIGDLVRVQRSMSELGLSQGFMLSALMNPSDVAGLVGAGRVGAFSSLNQTDQALLLRRMGGGQLTEWETESIRHSSQAGAFSQFVDPATGQFRAGDANALARTIMNISQRMASEIGGGPGLESEIMMNISKGLGLDLTGAPRTVNELAEAIKAGELGKKSMADIAEEGVSLQNDIKMTSEDGWKWLKEQGPLSKQVSAGIGEWWRDTSESLMLNMTRIFSGDAGDVRAFMRTRAGGATLTAFAEGAGISPMSIMSPDMLTAEQARMGVAGAMLYGRGSYAERMEAITALLEYRGAAGVSPGALPDFIREVTRPYQSLLSGGPQPQPTSPNMLSNTINQNHPQGPPVSALFGDIIVSIPDVSEADFREAWKQQGEAVIDAIRNKDTASK